MRRRGSSTGFLPAQREGHDAERPLQQHREGHPPSKRIRRTAPKSPGPRSPHPLRKREVSNRFRIWVAPRSRYALVPKQWDGSIFLWICKANLHAPVVGGDAGHSRSRRRSVTDVGLPLAGTHRPVGKLRIRRRFHKNQCILRADRVVRPYGIREKMKFRYRGQQLYRPSGKLRICRRLP